MCKQPDILESEKIHFAVMAIEAGAREMGISPMEMRRRLEKMNLIKRLLLDNYEVMHTQSLKHVGEDVAESFEKLGSTGGRKSMKTALYHGSTLSIEHPLAKVGRADLDFGNVCSISNSLIHSYILIRALHWIQWTEKEVINERTSTLEKNKIGIILLLSVRLEISPERALNLFYETNVCAMLHDSRYRSAT